MTGPGPGSRRIGDDPSDMTGRVVAFPEQLRDALVLALDGPDLLPHGPPARLFVVGMGGSAIGGDFLRAWAETVSSVPVAVVRDYSLPRPVDADAAALFVSYSGNTEETLEAWEQAARRGVARAAVTSGGELARRAEAERVPCLRIPGGSPPRAALGWSTVPLLVALGRVLPGTEDVPAAIADAADACERVLAASGPDAPGRPAVRDWAERAAEGFPIVVAPVARLAACALRWAGQLGENAKLPAHVALLPEQNHNEIVAWERPGPFHRTVCGALLADDRTHPQVLRRLDLVAATFEAAGGRTARFGPVGEGTIARLFSLGLLGDLASLWAAAARGVDPTPVASLERLKTELAREPERR